MKYSVLFLALLLIGACQSTAEKQGAPAEVSQIGKAISDSLLKTLGGNLSRAVQDSGFSGALKFCNIEAMPLTRQVVAENAAVGEVKRVSEKWRNPANQPDENDLAALNHFTTLAANGEALPAEFVQELGSGQYRYYRPLKVAALCLNCHGDPAHLAEGVGEQLQALYPEDKALGYEEGDFRGLVRVSVKMP